MIFVVKTSELGAVVQFLQGQRLSQQFHNLYHMLLAPGTHSTVHPPATLPRDRVGGLTLEVSSASHLTPAFLLPGVPGIFKQLSGVRLLVQTT